MIAKKFECLLVTLLVVLQLSNVCLGEPANNQGSARARLQTGRYGPQITKIIRHEDWVQLRVKFDQHNSGIFEVVKRTARGTLPALRRLVGPLKRLVVNVQISPISARPSKLPSWVRAQYSQGQIVVYVPAYVEADGVLESDRAELVSASLRHELTHAYVQSFTKQRAPGWLEEGLAQWTDPIDPPRLTSALRRRVLGGALLSLGYLNGPFTRLDKRLVPIAYAQSFFAVQVLINRYGSAKFRRFLSALRTLPLKRAFFHAYSLSFSDFESELRDELEMWAESDQDLIL